MKKDDLRSKYKQKRNLILKSELVHISNMIEYQIFSNFYFNANYISIFLPIQKQNEINTFDIIDGLKAFNCSIYVPKVISETNDLLHVLLTSNTKITFNNWGIPEPTHGEICSPELFDFVFVPLLACDIAGNRIGYGKGFYDSFLAKCKNTCKFIGLSHFELEETIIEDVYDGDIPLHFCVTPSKVHAFSRK